MRAALLTLLALTACAPNPEAAFDRAADQAAPPSAPALTMQAGALLPGAPFTVEVGGLAPGETVYVLRGAGVTPSGPCPAIVGGMCLEIRAPLVVLTSATADASGVARRTLTLPATVPTGLSVGLQAVAVRGPGGASSVRSPAALRVTGWTPASALTAGDLVLTEVLKDPTAVADAAGEWAELINTSGVDVDLGGLVVSDAAGGAFTLPSPTLVPDGEFLVLGASADPAVNGGVPVQVAWGGALSLDDADGGLTLSAGSTLIDEVLWDDGVTFPDASGQTLSLDPADWDALANDLGWAWCASAGTPGLWNDPCPCGDGALDPGEACDDGGHVLGDGCDAACQLEGCPLPEVQRGWTDLTAPGVTLVDTDLAPNGDLLVLGSIGSGSAEQAWLARLDGATLQPLWAETLDVNTTKAVAVAARPDGDVWVVLSDSFGYYEDEVVVARLDADGALVSKRRYGQYGYNYDHATDAAVGADGSLVISGWYKTWYVDDQWSFALGLYPNGDMRFGYDTDTQAYGEEQATGVVALRGGEWLMWGVSTDEWSPFEFPSKEGVWVARLGANGVRPWDGDLRVDYNAQIHDAVELYDGSIVLTGHRDTADLFVMKLAATGARLWSKSMPLAGASSAVVQLPETCDTNPVSGATCTTAGETCARTTGLVCTCDGVWTCGPETAKIGVLHGDWTVLDAAGAVVSGLDLPSNTPLDAFHHAGGVRVTAGGAGIGDVMDADVGLGLPCQQGVATPSTGGSVGTWTSSSSGYGGNEFTAADDFSLTITPVALPTATTTCSDALCP